MTPKTRWCEAYMAAVLEIDSRKIEERIKAAEASIRDRQRQWRLNHGDTREEKVVIANALNSLNVLRKHTMACSGRGQQNWL
jgi:hypothetical protein